MKKKALVTYLISDEADLISAEIGAFLVGKVFVHGGGLLIAECGALLAGRCGLMGSEQNGGKVRSEKQLRGSERARK